MVMEPLKKCSAKHLKVLAVLVGVTFFILTLFLSYHIKQQSDTQIRHTFQEKANMFRVHVEKTMYQNITLLVSMAKRWELEAGTSYPEWRLETEYLTKSHESFQAIEWVDPSFHVRWITPIKGNEQALDLNLAFEVHRRKALIAARDQKDVRVTRVVQLLQGGNGFLVTVPMFVKGQFQGFILGVFRLDTLLQQILEDADFQHYNMVVLERGQPVFTATNNTYQYHDDWLQTTNIRVENSRWSVRMWPKANVLTALDANQAGLVLGIGSFISVLLFLLILTLAMLRKRADVDAERSKKMELIFKGTNIIAEAKDFDEAMQQCIDFICETIDWEVGHAYILDATKHNKLVPTNIWHMDNRDELKDFLQVTQETCFNFGEGLPGRIWQSGMPVWIENIHKENNLPRAKKCGYLPLKGSVGFPIKTNNKVIAVLEFFHSKEQEYDERLMQTLSLLGKSLGVVWERKRVAKTLRESEEQQRLILDSVHEGIYGVDINGDLTFANPAAEQMLEYNIDELIGRDIHRLIHHTRVDGKPYPIHECPIYAASTDGRVHTISDEVFWRKDNTCFPVEYTSTPIHNEGEIVGAVVTFSDITEKLKMEEKLVKLARYDYLTDLPNRSLYDETLKQVIERSNRNNEFFGLLFLDLDGFKQINDTLGHDIGDLLLKDVAKRLKSVLRTYDFCARIGGDEFSIIVQDLSCREDAMLIANKIIKVLNERYHLENNQVSISASIGIAFYPDDAIDFKQLMKCADVALYKAKDNGRNQYQQYSG